MFPDLFYVAGANESGGVFLCSNSDQTTRDIGTTGAGTVVGGMNNVNLDIVGYSNGGPFWVPFPFLALVVEIARRVWE